MDALAGRQGVPRIVGRQWLVGAGILGGVGLLALGIGSIAVPSTFGRPTTPLVLGIALAAMGVLLGLAPRVASGGLLLFAPAWPQVITRILFASWAADGPGWVGTVGSDVLQVYLPIVLVAAAFALSLWRHPPLHDAAGRPVTVMRRLLALCLAAIVLGPVGGLIGWLGLTPGDIYGRALVVGLLVGVAGVLTWIGAAATWRIGARPPAAAGWFGVAWAAFLLLRLLAG